MNTSITNSALGIAKPVFEKWFERLVETVSIKYKTVMMKDREHFWNYLERTYTKFSKIRPVGFREQLDFMKVYIPLTLQSKKNEERNVVVDDYPIQLLSLQKHILIVDNAGMGKSTLSKRMFLGAFENGEYGIPLYVELRHLSKDNDVLQEILKQIRNLSSEFNEKLLSILLEKGVFVLFLDGYDEISLNDKEVVTEALLAFINKAGNNTFILTSRNDDALAGFQTFDQYSIKQLEESDAYKLLANLDDNGEKSRSLIQKLEEEEISGVKEFLVNPLLVTLLYTAFDYEPTIPTKKHLFYDQVFNAFFQQHDFSKGDGYVHDKKSKLAKDDFERILRCVGFASVYNHKVEFERTEIISIIKKSKEKCGLSNFNESDYLDDLVKAVPLFSKEGLSYKWSHKSLAEYFAVEYIAFDSLDLEQTIVERLYFNDKERNENLFDLYYDIKPAGFNRFLLLPCLEDIKNDVLPESENIQKIVFCTKMIGRSFYVFSKSQLVDKSEYEEGWYLHSLPEKLLENYRFFSKPNERKKWWTLLDILVAKHCLFEPLPREKNDRSELNAVLRYLDSNNNLCVDSSNISKFDDEVIQELNMIIPIKSRLLTRESCEKKIKSIKKDIEDNKDLTGWSIL